MADYDQAIQLNPKYARAYHNRGSAWGNKGDLDRAIADYNQAIRLDLKEAQILLPPRHGVGDETQSASRIGRLQDYAQLAPSDRDGLTAVKRVSKELKQSDGAALTWRDVWKRTMATRGPRYEMCAF